MSGELESCNASSAQIPSSGFGDNGAFAKSSAALCRENACVLSGVDEVGDDEELQYDPTAYDCMHVMSLDWPCLR